MSIQTIPLSKLVPSPLNVRLSGSGEVDDLAASIAAHGLLQNLTVIESGKFFEVVAGGRRLKALQQLRDDDRLPPDFPVPCLVTTSEAATEASLAENIERQDMHPADEFAAFKALADGGQSVAEIAARFGVTELLVKQRLKLANVSPRLFALYREGKANLAQMQALAVVDDHKAQEAAWDGVKHDYERSDWNLRERLTKASVRADDARVRFVGLEAYKAAGGAVNEDLFGRHSTVTDVALLNRLVNEGLASKVAEVEAEGWSWVDARVTFDHAEQAEYKVAGHPQNREPTAEEKGRLDALQKRIDELNELDDEGVLSAEQGDELDQLHEELDRLNDSLVAYSDELKAKSGAIVTPHQVYYARLKPGQKKGKDTSVNVSSHKRAAPGNGDKKPGDLSFAAVQRLQAEATAALRWEVATLPSVALALLCDRLAGRTLYNATHDRKRWVNIDVETSGRLSPDNAKAADETAAGAALDKLHDEWKAKLPKRYADLLPHLLRLDIGELNRLLAFLVGSEIDAVDFTPAKDTQPVALASAIGVDLTKHWEPTEDWLASLPKAAVMALVTDAAGKTAAAKLEKLKKDQLPAAALPLFPKGWLPKPLRGPKKDGPAKKPKAEGGKKAAAGDADE